MDTNDEPILGPIGRETVDDPPLSDLVLLYIT